MTETGDSQFVDATAIVAIKAGNGPDGGVRPVEIDVVQHAFDAVARQIEVL